MVQIRIYSLLILFRRLSSLFQVLRQVSGIMKAVQVIEDVFILLKGVTRLTFVMLNEEL